MGFNSGFKGLIVLTYHFFIIIPQKFIIFEGPNNEFIYTQNYSNKSRNFSLHNG